MKHCKECLHVEVCEWRYLPEAAERCVDYKDKTKYVEQELGRWEETIKHGMLSASNNIGCVCSCCCKWSDNDYNYCPNCGAKMDGE